MVFLYTQGYDINENLVGEFILQVPLVNYSSNFN